MVIEDSMLVRGGNELSDKILRFIDTIVVKNEQEIDINETSESYAHYIKYRRCLGGNTTFADHVFTSDDIPSDLVGYSVDGMTALLRSGNLSATNFIKLLRKDFIDNYVDMNPYCAMICGYPSSGSQSLMITNLDIGGEISIHKVNPVTTPKTYHDLYINNTLADYVTMYGDKYPYIKYLSYKVDITKVRESDQFEILWCDTGLIDNVDIEYFLDSYNTVRNFVLNNKYIKSLESAYDCYSNFELLVILMGTFQRICLSYVDKYSLRIYTDKEIYDILDSNNLSKLKNVSMSVLRRIVENLDMLLSYKGTQDILGKIIDVVDDDNNITNYIHKYKLVKVYDDPIDPDDGYDKSTDLGFVSEVVIGDPKKKVDPNEEVIPYDDFVKKDKTWGDETDKIKDDIKKIDFNSLNTKYYGVVGILNIYSIYDRMMHKIGLLIQYYGGFNKLDDVIVEFDGVNTTSLDLLSAAYYGFRIIEKIETGITDSDLIDSRCYSYETMMKFNTMNYVDTVNAIRNITFRPFGCKHDVIVGNVLSEKEIGYYVYTFNMSIDSFDNIMDQFDFAYDKYTKLGVRSTESGDYHKIMAWKKVYEWFTVSTYADDDYIGYTSFETFFFNRNVKFFNKIKMNIIDVSNASGVEDYIKSRDVENYSKSCLDAFKVSISKLIREENIGTDTSIVYNYTRDLNLLIDSFVSIYVELREISIHLDMTDVPNNRFQLMDTMYAKYTSSHEDLYKFSYEFSIQEYCSFMDGLLIDDGYSDIEIYDRLDGFELNDKFNVKHISDEELLYRFDEDVSIITSVPSGDTYGYVDSFSIKDI